MNHAKTLSSLVLLILLSAAVLLAQQPSLTEQLTYKRVRAARDAADSSLRRQFAYKKLSYPAKKILLRIFKAEKEVEIWVASADTMALFAVYPFCFLSGELGPKRREGDLQVPEGLYHLSYYNPESTFYLSMKISYPNPSDRLLKSGSRAGGEIFIHDDCVSIGCVPMEDYILPLYWLCVQARYTVAVHCFPARSGGSLYAQAFAQAAPLIQTFWQQLMVFAAEFDRTHRIPRYTIDPKGSYRIQK